MGFATEDGFLHSTPLGTADVDDTPVDGATEAPISSNWAYDHEASTDPHPNWVDDEPVDEATTTPVSSNWAYDFQRQIEEAAVLAALEAEYNTLMLNENNQSCSRGFEIR